jgi:DNA-binding HxlR family transcriptional regulator
LVAIMAKRSYDEYCGLAKALDLLGERWTMLILRELLMGPKRFTDLLGGLPGIGTGLLTQRLRELEDAQVIEKAVLPPPAASAVYQLTDDGRTLRPALLGLTRWGMRRLGPPAEGQTVSVNQVAFAMAARFNPDSSPTADGTYELRIDDATFQFTIQRGEIEILAGQVPHPHATISTDMATLIALNNGSTNLESALGDQSLVIDGSPDAVTSLAIAFEIDADSAHSDGHRPR